MIEFALLGLGIAAVYTLLAQGIVLIFRGSGVVNLAQGSFALTGAFCYLQLRQIDGWSFWPAFVASVIATTVLGLLVYHLVMRPLRNSAPVVRLIATLGIVIIVQAAAVLRYGPTDYTIASTLPQSVVHLGSNVVPEDQLWLFLIALLSTIVLWSVSKYTLIGLASSAIAENQQAASTLGWSPDRVASLNWAVGGALAGVAGILVVPLTGLQAETLTLIVISVLAAALVGRLSSFPLTFLGAVGIGVAQSEMAQYWHQQGVANAVPLLVIVLVLFLRGKTLPSRADVTERLPKVGSGLVRPMVLIPLTVILAVLIEFILPVNWTVAIGVSLMAAVFLLSLVVLTGFAGQISLAQYALGGVAAYLAGRLVSVGHWPMWLAMLCGLVGAVAVGLLIGLPALRVRGVNLAVVTLGLGLAIQAVLFNNTSYTGGLNGTTVGPTRLFGINLDPVSFPVRYTLFALVVFVILGLGVANLRRSRAGRRLIAVRSNERAASALGINVVTAKLFAFGVSSFIAGAAGILVGFSAYQIVYSNYDPISSITAVAYSVIGGVGYATGPLYGSQFAQGGIGTLIGNSIFGTNVANWIALGGGVIVILLLIRDPDGLAATTVRQVNWIASKALPNWNKEASIRSADEENARLVKEAASDPTVRQPMKRATGPFTKLRVETATVRFGGVVAVDHVSLLVESGEIFGLIGPNGAGKTTMIDAITGFVTLTEGQVYLGEDRIDGWSIHRRARAGISRSFQSLELFDDLTVHDNILAATEPRDAAAWATSVFRPGRGVLPPAALASVRAFGLEADLDQLPAEVPFGRQRLVAVARAMATEAAIVLLDEPAAGLDDTESAELAQLIRRAVDERGIGVLLVEHDMNFVMSICDRIAVVDFGHEICEGTPQEVRQDTKVIAAYLGESPPPEDGSGTEMSNPPLLTG